VQHEDREALEAQMAADLRALTAASDAVGQTFAAKHAVTANDFRALLHVTVAEGTGRPLTAGELRQRMGVSAAAITYLVERMVDSGHLLREVDQADRRRVKLRMSEQGMTVARGFFTPLAEHAHHSMAELTDEDLRTAHRVFTALGEAMQRFLDELGHR
jgi:DNA-binding MarR family transcriptional regulator